MADVEITAGERPLLATIADVELVDAGLNWPLIADGTEDGTFTATDIAAAIAAVDDPSIRSPRVIFGHREPQTAAAFGPGSPVWGGATNMRTTNEGNTLVCDLEGVPAWLAEVLPHAWPSRSIQGRRNVTSETGATHALVIDFISFLGVELPAISTLEDVRAVYAARTATEANVTVKEDTMPTTQAARSGQVLAAGVTEEDVRRAFYADPPVAGPYPWIRSIELEPFAVIVDVDDGGLWRLPFSIDGTDVTFGQATQVRIEYVAAGAGATTSASRAGTESIVYASRDESRKGVAGMEVAELRKALNLGDDVSDEDVMSQAVAKLAATPAPTTDTGQAATPPAAPAPTSPATPPATPPAPPTGEAPAPTAPTTPPPGFTLIADGVLEEIKQGAAQGIAASATLARQAEDAFIAKHRRRIGPESNPAAKRTEDHLRREWQRNQGEAEAFASILPERMATVPGGHDGGNDDGVANQFEDLVSAVWPGVAAVRAERAKKGS